MSVEARNSLLRLLDAAHAFDPVALPGYRNLFYVPFEETVGGVYESRLRQEIANTQRVALIGPIGSGKSSTVEHVLQSDADRLAPIWISAGHEGEQTLQDPPEFARHLIREVISWARDAGAMGQEDRQRFLSETALGLPTKSRAEKQSISLKMALRWIEPGWSREVQETVADPEIERNRGDFIDSLDRLVALIYEDLDRTPVLIIDDSDRWLRLRAEIREELLDAFFNDTCRMLAERNWSLVMAVHPEYCATTAFRGATSNGFLNVQVEVPQLSRSAAIRALVEARIRVTLAGAEEGFIDEEGRGDGDVAIDDVFEEGFEALLLEYYQANDLNLRAMLTVIQQALQETILLDETKVSVAALREAVLGLS